MKSFAHALWIAACLTIGGCNTVKGVGQDLQKAGTAIENVAKKN